MLDCIYITRWYTVPTISSYSFPLDWHYMMNSCMLGPIWMVHDLHHYELKAYCKDKNYKKVTLLSPNITPLLQSKRPRSKEKILPHFSHDIQGRWRNTKLQHQCPALAREAGFDEVWPDEVNKLFTQRSTAKSTIAATWTKWSCSCGSRGRYVMKILLYIIHNTHLDGKFKKVWVSLRNTAVNFSTLPKIIKTIMNTLTSPYDVFVNRQAVNN